MIMRKIDLHTHSNYSDGEDSINQLIKTAISRGLGQIAITDHMSAFGHFLFTFSNPVKTVEEYLTEISRLRTKYKNQIEIYAGAEISADFLNISKNLNPFYFNST